MPPRKAAPTPASSKKPTSEEEILYCFYNKRCDSSTCGRSICPEFWQQFTIPEDFDKRMMVKKWVEISNLSDKPASFTFCGAFPVEEAEINCPIVMQPHFELVPAMTMGYVINNYRGVCIVSVGM